MLRNILRKQLPILLAVGLISIAAAAQQSASNGQQSAPEKGGWRRGMPDAAQRTQALTQKLNLTSDQQAKVQDIFKSEHSQMESVRQDSALSQRDRRSKMMDIHKSNDTQIRAILDSDQQKRWDEMQAKREQWMQKGRHGAPDAPDADDQPGPPPQP